MKIVQLHNLLLSNIKGTPLQDIAFNGSNTLVYGANGTGKTTLFDGYSWTLFDKNSTNQSAFNLKTLAPSGEAINFLEHRGVVSLSVDGKPIVFERVYTETWETPRNGTAKVFSGHESKYKVNGVPSTKGEFESRVAEICETGMFRLLSHRQYFNEVLSWQERRLLLLKMCGDISDSDIFDAEPKLARLRAMDGTVADIRKITVEARKGYNKIAGEIPVKINELKLLSTPTTTHAVLSKKRDEDRKKLEELRSELLRVKNGGQTAELTRQRAEVDAQIQDCLTKSAREFETILQGVKSKIAERNISVARQVAAAAEFDRTIGLRTEEFKRASLELDSLRAVAREYQATQYEPKNSESCPSCGQSLPADRIEEIRQSELEAFNQHKSQHLEKIIAEGTAKKAAVARLQAEIDEATTALANSRPELEATRDVLLKEQAELTALMESHATEEPSGALQALADQKAEIESKIADLGNDSSDAEMKLTTEISDLVQAMKADEIELDRIATSKRSTERIAELVKEQKANAKELEECDATLFALDLYVTTKVSLLTDKINSRFAIAKFKLFDTLVNGNIVETCQTTVNGVPYSDLNAAMKTNVSLDIINAFSRFVGIAVPVFIDGAESTSEPLATEGQQIQLVVSKEDKQLRVTAY